LSAYWGLAALSVAADGFLSVLAAFGHVRKRPMLQRKSLIGMVLAVNVAVSPAPAQKPAPSAHSQTA
jgi:hypothetical protein